MRLLRRNLTTIYVCNLKGAEDIFLDGHFTGKKKLVYDTPIKVKAFVSTSQGVAEIAPFGLDIQYDRVVVFEKARAPKGLTENSVLFIGKPYAKSEGTPLYNYRITKISPSLNYTVLAVKQV